MPKNLSPLILRALAGFLIGLAIWAGLSIPYTRLLGFVTETALRVVEAPALTHLTPNGTMLVVERNDVRTPRTVGNYAIETTDLTFNLIVLLTLFAATAHPFADRNMKGLGAALLGLMIVHVAAVMSFAEAYYALSFGAWSTAHYGALARRFWGAAPYFYSIVGVYGSAVALWWIFRPDPQPPGGKTPQTGRDTTRPSRRRRG